MMSPIQVSTDVPRRFRALQQSWNRIWSSLQLCSGDMRSQFDAIKRWRPAQQWRGPPVRCDQALEARAAVARAVAVPTRAQAAGDDSDRRRRSASARSI